MTRPRPPHRIPTRLRPALGILVAVFGVLCVQADDSEKKLPDPVPIRRVLLPADQLEKELKKAGEGAYRRLDRVEFERLVQDAARGSAREAAPRLAEAKYRAKLVEGSGRTPSLSGTAQWKVVHTGRGQSLLRLEEDAIAMNFSISNPRFENRDAILTYFPERKQGAKGTLALLVDRPGSRSVAEPCSWMPASTSRRTQHSNPRWLARK